MKREDLVLGEPFPVWETDDEWIAEELHHLTDQEHPPFDPGRALRQLAFEIRPKRLVGTRHMVEHAITHERTREVILNSQLPQSRQRFTLAHELGHVMRHHDLGALARDGRSEPAELRRVADRFATVFLMPQGAVFAAIRRLGTLDVDILAGHFAVSPEAMRLRLLELRAAQHLENG